MTDKLTKAISSLITTAPFYATLILYLKVIEDESIGTMATDGVSLIYNAKWFDSLPLEQGKGTVAHEGCHCGLQHPIRMGDRDPILWNIACDYVVNAILIKAGFKLPDSVLLDSQYDSMGAEEVYSRLKRQVNVNGGNIGARTGPQAGLGQGGAMQGTSQGATASPGPTSNPLGKGLPGGLTPCPWGMVQPTAPVHAQAVLGQASAEWDRRVRQAIATARAHGQGNLPGDLEAIANEIKKPRIDHREQLRRFIDNRARIDYSWVNPNKRMLGSGIILPGIKADGITKLGIAVDTSGSVDLELLSQFYSDIQAAMEEGAVQETIVIQCDARIQNVKRYEAGDTVDFKTYGRGGTLFSPAVKWFEDNEPEISAMIYFTDLQSSDFGKEPEFPVLWYGYGLESQLKNLVPRVPFGEVVEVHL